jgi:hypothetical protein
MTIVIEGCFRCACEQGTLTSNIPSEHLVKKDREILHGGASAGLRGYPPSSALYLKDWCPAAHTAAMLSILRNHTGDRGRSSRREKCHITTNTGRGSRWAVVAVQPQATLHRPRPKTCFWQRPRTLDARGGALAVWSESFGVL